MHYFPFIFPIPQPPQEPIMLHSVCFQDTRVNALVCLVTNTQHLRARKDCQSPVKFYVEKLLMMPSGPVSFRGGNELLRQTCRSCTPFAIRKGSTATRESCQAQGLSGFNEGLVLPMEIKLAYQLDYLIFTMSFAG